MMAPWKPFGVLSQSSLERAGTSSDEAEDEVEVVLRAGAGNLANCLPFLTAASIELGLPPYVSWQIWGLCALPLNSYH